MKKTLLLGWAAAAAVLLTGACNQVPQPSTDSEPGKLIVKPVLDGHAAVTRGASTTPVGKETTINNMQLLVFDNSGHLEYYDTFDNDESEIVFSLRAGAFKAWVIANGPSCSDLKTEAALKARVINLSEYNNPESGFVMAGSGNGTVVAGQTGDCLIEISRLVARVSLKSVTSQLPAAYGAITVNYAMIENVVAQYTVNGAVASPLWYNPMGRMTESPLVQAHVVNPPTYAADQPQLTFRSIGSSLNRGGSYSTVQRFYAYPNATATDHTGFATTFTARYTRLVVKATIDGTAYYYPISLPTIARNNCYDINLTLIGLGSSDPDTPVAKGSYDISISVDPWGDGGEVTETI